MLESIHLIPDEKRLDAISTQLECYKHVIKMEAANKRFLKSKVVDNKWIKLTWQ